MIVETKVVGRRIPFERRPVEVPGGPHTLRSLLTQLVRQEVGAYQKRQSSVGLLRVLMEKELGDGAATGVIRVTPQERGAPVDTEEAVRNAWEAEISERTPLGAHDLTGGAVDVAWFRRMYRALGAGRFATLLGAAKYASSGGGHKRAELYARALLGEVPEDELWGRIAARRNQDAVRALGLLPISRASAKASREVEGRYRLLSDFRREARQFGAQRQASERLAADIGMQNLARGAGSSDPQRLMWAMEAQMAPDWTRIVRQGDLTVGLDLAPGGEASLRVQRGEKVLKTLPPALKKNPDVVALRTTQTELEATRKRMRAVLEEAMTRGDLFTPGGVARPRPSPRHRAHAARPAVGAERGTPGLVDRGHVDHAGR